MGGAIRIEGLADLRKELRAAADASPREVTKQLKIGAQKVTARARSLVPSDGRNRIAPTLAPFATQRKAGVRSSHPGAAVEEFAKGYKRRNRGGDGTNTVTIRRGPSPPRFAYRAIDELGPGLVRETFDALVEILKCHGWFRET